MTKGDLKEKKNLGNSLPDERYDRELYKQAVRAAKQAKEVEKRSKRRKKFKRISLYILISVLLGLGIYISLPFLKPKPQYLTVNEIPTYLQYEGIDGESLSSSSKKVISPTDITSQGAIVFNPSNGDVLYEKNIDDKKSVASLTKLLSAIVVLETFQLDETINVSTENIPEDLDWQLGLKDGDKISVENILKAMLISSYNDSAYIIANAYPYGGYDAFVKAMNRKAKTLRMESSSFSNPAGIDEVDNYSTTKDIAILTAVSRKYPLILETVNTSKEVINWSTQEGLVSKEILTTNQLYGTNRYIKGLKTGITDLAGQCFAGYYVYPNGNELIIVVIDSQKRFEETALLEKYAREILK